MCYVIVNNVTSVAFESKDEERMKMQNLIEEMKTDLIGVCIWTFWILSKMATRILLRILQLCSSYIGSETQLDKNLENTAAL